MPNQNSDTKNSDTCIHNMYMYMIYIFILYIVYCICICICILENSDMYIYIYRYRVIQQQERSPYIVLSTPNWHINLRRRAGACCCAVPPCPDRQGPWGLEHGWGSHACRESPADEEVRSKMGDSQAQRNKHQLRDNRSIT
jgi:hypothetical protein